MSTALTDCLVLMDAARKADATVVRWGDFAVEFGPSRLAVETQPVPKNTNPFEGPEDRLCVCTHLRDDHNEHGCLHDPPCPCGRPFGTGEMGAPE